MTIEAYQLYHLNNTQITLILVQFDIDLDINLVPLIPTPKLKIIYEVLQLIQIACLDAINCFISSKFNLQLGHLKEATSKDKDTNLHLI